MFELAARNGVKLPYRSVEVFSLQPTQSLDALAQAYSHELPRSVQRALGGMGALKGGGGALDGEIVSVALRVTF